MTQNELLPTPAFLKATLPLSNENREFVKTSRETIANILSSKIPKLLVILGPCSIHDIHAALEYAYRLKKLALDLSPHLYFVMRVYYEKPRTNIGWKGFLYDPELNGSFHIAKSLPLLRELMLKIIELKIPIASELLDPLAVHYFNDLISWGCIGARTATSQIHRQLVSQLPFPVAFKNTTDGSIDNALHGILASEIPHSSLGLTEEGQIAHIKSKGNSHGHLILRGSVHAPNYDSQSIHQALVKLKEHALPSRILIDCSHDNSKKNPAKQKVVLNSVIEQYLSGNTAIRGVMLESYIHEGAQILPQDLSRLKYGVSITDPCLSWEETESLLQGVVQKLNSSSVSSPSQPNTCISY